EHPAMERVEAQAARGCQRGARQGQADRRGQARARTARSLLARPVGDARVAASAVRGLEAAVLRQARGDRDGGADAHPISGVRAGPAFANAGPTTLDVAARVPLWLTAIAGALVGFGTRACNGCTSGHGLCGMSRFSKRSIVATMTFFGVGVATATITGYFLRH